jgi:hypothetical protein
MNKLLRLCASRHIAGDALKIALVVGSLLNIINQGEQLLHGGTISGWHMLLNYLVPYCVASYSAAKNELEQEKLRNGQTKR